MSAFPNVFSLEKQNVLITGGGTGIGQAIAVAMHAAGASVVLVGRREAELRATAQQMGERAHVFVHDITHLNDADKLVQRVVEQVGPIHCLVNNAGIHLKKPAVETTMEEFQNVLNTHILGAHALIRVLAPGMISRKSGSILFTASMASIFGIPQVVAYSAAKGAMLGMVRTLATELSPQGVRVNAIAPGWIETEMSRKAFAGDPARAQKVLGRTPLAKFGKPSDIGWAAVYLASAAAEFVTGVTLPVDGGVSIGF
ncbi:MAG TPA: SDR family oxidoreductase [Opitutaceae bacterium]|nr:SDR family oxidoreductase [Opitutaceae bacterium]